MGGLKGVAISDIVHLSLMGYEVVKRKQPMGPKRQRQAGWSILVMDKEKFHDLLTQEGLPSVGARVGLGTTEKLTCYSPGLSTQVQMGPHATSEMYSHHGTPQGAGQSIHAGDMNTFLAVVRPALERSVSHVPGSVQLVWVDGVLALAVSPLTASASGGPVSDHPMQIIPVHTLTQERTIQDIANPVSKMQWWCSDSSGRPSSASKGRWANFWVTDSAARRAYSLEGGDVLTSKDLLKLPGCTIFLLKRARVPAGLAGIRCTTHTDLEQYR